MGLIDEARKILGQLLQKLPHFVIFLGLAGISLSFAKYEKQLYFPSEDPNWLIFIIGCLLIVAGFVIYYWENKKLSPLKNHMTLNFGLTTLNIKIGNLEDEENLTNDSVFVLPANATFTDDCINDSNTALGSFFKKHHEEKISAFHQSIKKIIKKEKINPTPGTVLLLPEEFSIKSKVILVASSTKSKNKGFYTDPAIIANSICNIFKTTADKRINTFYLPVIGSGHGGLDITEALNLLILNIKFYLKNFNHVKNVFIFIRKVDKKKIKAHFLNIF